MIMVSDGCNIGQAGTLESNDVMITVAPGQKGSGVVIELTSIVMDQYGDAIRHTLRAVAAEQKISDIMITAVDRGALDCTLRARLLAALSRAGLMREREAV
jgi:citrate lyase subunit gamma (acyl carrier protein)